MVQDILTNTVVPRIWLEYLQRLSAGGTIKVVRLSVKDSDFEYGFD